MVNLNGHEAGNGGNSQGTPTARRAFLLCLPQIPSAANAFEIRDIQEDETEGKQSDRKVTMLHLVENRLMEFSVCTGLAGIIKGSRWRERKKALAVLGCLRGIRTVVIARAVPFTRLLAG
jgi:hypothetical protein